MTAGRALITGASGGIGAELARLHAARGGDLVIVARREAELDALKAELEGRHGVSVSVIAIDLTEPDSAARIFAAAPEIDILINNAGFGGHGPFHEQALDRHRRMVALNIEALTALSHLYLPGMIARGQGRILNVSSTASFLPGPLMAVYFATKAYVTSFSHALAEEVRGTGVTVTALCPGPVSTGFGTAADMEGVSILDRAVTADVTAQAGYEGMMAGKLTVFDQTVLGLTLRWVVPFLPRRLVLWASRRSMEKG